MKFTFKRPVFLRGYSFTFGNDCEHRDPVQWLITIIPENETELASEEIHYMNP